MNPLLIATHNAGKKAELAALLSAHGLTLFSLTDFNLPAPAETGKTFAENALIKARAAYMATKIPTLVDDSGLCVNALGGAPGVHTADWAPLLESGERDYAQAMQRIFAGIGGGLDTSANFICTLAYINEKGDEHLFTGQCAGDLIYPGRGDAGFGFDPYFIPQGSMQSFAQMPAAMKEVQSHRARALRFFIDALSA